MNSPGYYSLGEFTVTTPDTQEGEWITDLDGMIAADLQFQLRGGSGGSSIKAYVQTSLDQGVTAIDVACFTAGTTSITRARTIARGGTGALTPSDGALADDTVAYPMVLGDRLRVKLASLGTYGGSTVVAVTAVAA